MQIRSALKSSARRILTGLCIVLATAALAQAQPASSTGRFEDHVYRDGEGEHRYTVFLPAGYRADKKYPAILFLHGAGERGADGRKQLTVGLAPYVKVKAATFPFVVVFPQCEDIEGRLLTSWKADTADGQRALKILDEVQAKFGADPQRTALVGWSMGGYGAWSLGAAHPARWSAVVAMSGGADLDTVAGLKNTPVWAFHGAKDKLVLPTESRLAVDALKAAGGKVAYTEFPEIGHTPFEETFPNDGLIRWLLDPQKAPAQLAVQSHRATPLVPAPPFVPVLEVPDAVGIRLGNDVLHDLSYAAPQMVPANLLSGSLGDMYDTTSAAGRTFQVTFSGLSYHGQLERVYIKATSADHLLVQLGLRNITLTIGNTSISGARHSAQAGPITIGIGQRGPVWLNLDLTPTVVGRAMKLRLNGAGFQIPVDNFSVSQPAGVSVQGFGMTEERVVSSLTSGLYGSRERIENEVRSIAPRIVQQLEEKLNLAADAGALLSGLWPLPVYAPAMKAWPQRLTADQDGLTLVVGLTAAHPDPFAPAKPLRTVSGAGVSVAALRGEKSLKIALAPQILTPLTNMLIDEDLGIINVLDIPEKTFARLADKAELQAILPDLARQGDALQTRTVLRMAAPLETGMGSEHLQFQLPKLLVTVSVNADPEAPRWKHCAEFELDVRQDVQPSLSKPTYSRREVLLGWKPGETVTGTGRFVEGYQAENTEIRTDKFVELFRESWSNWTQHGSAAESSIPDVGLGNVKLRISELNWQSPAIVIGFKPAGVKVTNLSSVPFTYETKGPYSGWGGPYTLKPGDSHEYAIPFPLTYRRQSGSMSEVYTLISGSHSEFRVPVTGGAPRLFQARTP